MSSKLTLHSYKSRFPKPGTGFLLVRLLGGFFKILGGLLSAAAGIGFIVTLVRAGSTLAGALQFLEQKMAGFIAAIIVGILLLFLLLGLSGLILLGTGFALSHWGTTNNQALKANS